MAPLSQACSGERERGSLRARLAPGDDIDAQEELIYYAADNFSRIGWALALIGIIASALSGRRLSVAARIANAAIAAAVAALFGFIAFFAAYAYGTSNYLFSFT